MRMPMGMGVMVCGAMFMVAVPADAAHEDAYRVPTGEQDVLRVRQSDLPVPSGLPGRQEAPPSVAEQADPHPDFPSGRLAIGTRFLRFDLHNNRKGAPFDRSFIGSIDKLEEVQDYLPLRTFVQYSFLPWFGVGLQYDRLKIKTLTTIPGADRDTDGNVIMKGVLPYLVLRYANPTFCTPFLEGGLARYRNRFVPHPDWYAGGRRMFRLEHAVTSFYWGCGLEFEVNRQVHIDVYFRTMDIDVSGKYHFRGDARPPEPFVFTMGHTACGAGVRVLF